MDTFAKYKHNTQTEAGRKSLMNELYDWMDSWEAFRTLYLTKKDAGEWLQAEHETGYTAAYDEDGEEIGWCDDMEHAKKVAWTLLTRWEWDIRGRLEEEDMEDLLEEDRELFLCLISPLLRDGLATPDALLPLLSHEHPRVREAGLRLSCSPVVSF